MYEEAMKVDFDVALIGCGAYGVTLAGKIKAAGKTAIHMGASTFVWNKRQSLGEDNALYNEYWVRPDESERIKSAEVIERECY